MQLSIFARLVSDSNFELGDAARWKQTRFAVEPGMHWRGNNQPGRISSHVKRLVTTLVIINSL